MLIPRRLTGHGLGKLPVLVWTRKCSHALRPRIDIEGGNQRLGGAAFGTYFSMPIQEAPSGTFSCVFHHKTRADPGKKVDHSGLKYLISLSYNEL